MSRAACPLDVKQPVGKPFHIEEDACLECHECLDLGCPAIEAKDGKPHISEYMCGGCSLCEQVCPVGVIKR